MLFIGYHKMPCFVGVDLILYSLHTIDLDLSLRHEFSKQLRTLLLYYFC